MYQEIFEHGLVNDLKKSHNYEYLKYKESYRYKYLIMKNLDRNMQDKHRFQILIITNK